MARVRILPSGRRVVVSASTVKDLLYKLGVSIEDAVVLKNGRVVGPWEELGEEDEVEVYLARSGG